MSKRVSITPEVHDVLARATVVGTAERPVVQLPPGQLPRDLYVATDKVLKALGGKWNRGQNGHVFDRPVEGELAEALNNGVAVNQANVAEQFFTPAAVADQLVLRVGVVGADHVLEPSAGAGALVAAVARQHSAAVITAVEQDPRLVAKLRAEWGTRAIVDEADFLSWRPGMRPIDRVVMNPPFSRGQDTAHVTHALQLLRTGGTLAAIMSPHWRFADDARAKGFRAMANQHSYSWEPLPAATFRESGTDVNTGILTLRKGSDL
jgi:predicted RNA methylase